MFKAKCEININKGKFMKVLIAYKKGNCRSTLQEVIANKWKNSAISYAENLSALNEYVFTDKFDLLILDAQMFVQTQLHSFIAKAIQYNKVIVFSDLDYFDRDNEILVEMGVFALLPKNCAKEQIENTLALL